MVTTLMATKKELPDSGDRVTLSLDARRSSHGTHGFGRASVGAGGACMVRMRGNLGGIRGNLHAEMQVGLDEAKEERWAGHARVRVKSEVKF